MSRASSLPCQKSRGATGIGSMKNSKTCRHRQRSSHQLPPPEAFLCHCECRRSHGQPCCAGGSHRASAAARRSSTRQKGKRAWPSGSNGQRHCHTAGHRSAMIARGIRVILRARLRWQWEQSPARAGLRSLNPAYPGVRHIINSRPWPKADALKIASRNILLSASRLCITTAKLRVRLEDVHTLKDHLHIH